MSVNTVTVASLWCTSILLVENEPRLLIHGIGPSRVAAGQSLTRPKFTLAHFFMDHKRVTRKTRPWLNPLPVRGRFWFASPFRQRRQTNSTLIRGHGMTTLLPGKGSLTRSERPFKPMTGLNIAEAFGHRPGMQRQAFGFRQENNGLFERLEAFFGQMLEGGLFQEIIYG